MAIVIFWLLVVLATGSSWYILRFVGNPKPLAWVFLFWVGVVGFTAVLLYLVSVFLAV